MIDVNITRQIQTHKHSAAMGSSSKILLVLAGTAAAAVIVKRVLGAFGVGTPRVLKFCTVAAACML